MAEQAVLCEWCERPIERQPKTGKWKHSDGWEAGMNHEARPAKAQIEENNDRN
jgi:hypothetical protein